MSSENLSTYIRLYRAGQSKIIDKIIDKMAPLIKKYSSKFPYSNRDDVYQELVITLIDCVNTIPDYTCEAQCLSYFKKSIVCKYIYLKKYYMQLYEYSFDDPEFHFQEPVSDNPFYQVNFKIEIQKIYNSLSPKKKNIFIGLINGYSCIELAQKLNLSRQYINKVKNEIKSMLTSNNS